jgi:cysteine desulfurase
MRAGTENIYGIVGFSKALDLAMEKYEADKTHIQYLKMHLHNKLQAEIDGIVFNGDPLGESLYTVLSAGFPLTERSEMLLFNLDVNNICVSGGSACSSGANQGSHVINALNKPRQSTVRFSFSKYNTFSELDAVVTLLKQLI